MKFRKKDKDKGTKTHEKTGVFGVRLSKSVHKIPPFVEKAIAHIEAKGLDTPGLFRVNGDNVKMQEAKRIIDEVGDYDFALFPSVHEVAGLLKMYFRELPEPLLTFEAYDMFIAAHGVPDDQIRLEMIKKVLHFLPTRNMLLLRVLCQFLNKVKLHKDANKMDSSNLAICFAPNLLRSPVDSVQIMLGDANYANGLMSTLIDECEQLFADMPDTSELLNGSSSSDHSHGDRDDASYSEGDSPVNSNRGITPPPQRRQAPPPIPDRRAKPDSAPPEKPMLRRHLRSSTTIHYSTTANSNISPLAITRTAEASISPMKKAPPPVPARRQNSLVTSPTPNNNSSTHFPDPSASPTATTAASGRSSSMISETDQHSRPAVPPALPPKQPTAVYSAPVRPLSPAPPPVPARSTGAASTTTTTTTVTTTTTTTAARPSTRFPPPPVPARKLPPPTTTNTTTTTTFNSDDVSPIRRHPTPPPTTATHAVGAVLAKPRVIPSPPPRTRIEHQPQQQQQQQQRVSDISPTRSRVQELTQRLDQGKR